MADDEYELLPHKEIADLRKELQKMKEGGNSDSRNSTDRLSDSINNMLSIFREASEHVNLEEQEEVAVSKQLEPLKDKVDQLLDQNQKIAEGIITIADMLKEINEKLETRRSPEMPRFEPEPDFMPPRQMPPMQPMGPPRGMRMPPPPRRMPPI